MKPRKPLQRYSLRALLALVTVACCMLAACVSWRNQRAAFLRSQADLGSAFAHATSDIDYKIPRVEILDPKWNSLGKHLSRLGVEPISSIDVTIVVKDQDLCETCDMFSYDEVVEARRLFPEAQLIIGIIPESIMGREPRDEW